MSTELGPTIRSIDAETRATSEDHHALRLWLRLYACTSLVESRVRRRLQTRFATTLPRFDLMAQLERSPRGLRMSELSNRLMVTGGNVTGLTDNLESEGLVVRESDGADRRALRVKLTREGRRVFRAMAAEHERWIVQMFAGLSAREARSLAEQLNTLKQHILDTVPLDER
jgi:DNA-binding MarR family transcriptional regulator